MSNNSAIEWTEATWNPVTGCTRASEGCDNCYAVSMTRRIAGYGNPKYQGLVNPGKQHFNGRVLTHPDVLSEPLRRKKPTTYFVCSMSDLFHDAVPFSFIDQVFAIMALCPQHTFQLLTKRADRAAEYFAQLQKVATHWGNTIGGSYSPAKVLNLRHLHLGGGQAFPDAPWPLPNVWVGTSVENQEQADKRIFSLLKVPAAVRFLSLEPLLGPINLTPFFYKPLPDAVRHIHQHGALQPYWDPAYQHYKRGLIHWVILGGESGPKARPMHLDWVLSLRDQCQTAGAAFFFKQWGDWQCFTPFQHKPDGIGAKGRTDWHNWAGGCVSVRLGKKKAGRELDGRIHNDLPTPTRG